MPATAMSTGKFIVAKLIVTRDKDYRWPSGSLTAFKAGAEVLTVKAEVLQDAVAKGWGKDGAPATDTKRIEIQDTGK